MFCDLSYNLSCRMFHVYLKRKNVYLAAVGWNVYICLIFYLLTELTLLSLYNDLLHLLLLILAESLFHPIKVYIPQLLLASSYIKYHFMPLHKFICNFLIVQIFSYLTTFEHSLTFFLMSFFLYFPMVIFESDLM